jgi:hypothetical protein
MIAGNPTAEPSVTAPGQDVPARPLGGTPAFETGLIVCGLLAMFFLLPHALRGDDITRLNDINQLLDHGKLTNSRFSLVMPLISVPVLMLSHVTQTRAYWAAHFNTLVIAAGVLIGYFLIRGRYDARLFRLTVIVLLFASFLTNRLRDYNAETTTAVLVTLGIICLATNRYVVAGWAAIVLGVVNTPAAIIGLILLAAWYTARTRRLRHLLPILAAGALIMLEAWVRRGGPFVTGYGGQKYNESFVIGLVSILFSFGRGLLFFTPGLALWCSGRMRRLVPGRSAVVMMLVFLAGLILIYSKWWAWYGGVSWGPRFFTFATIPASLLIAVGVWRAGRSPGADALTLGVLAFSTYVALAGGLVYLQQELQLCRADPIIDGCFYKPQDSGLWQFAVTSQTLTLRSGLLALLIVGAFVYLAIPLAKSAVRPIWPRRSWITGWHI